MTVVNLALLAVFGALPVLSMGRRRQRLGRED